MHICSIIFRRAKTRIAMKREIAPSGGNFRGVCPVIGRLKALVSAYIAAPDASAGILPAFVLKRNDTHGIAYSLLSTYPARPQVLIYVIF